MRPPSHSLGFVPFPFRVPVPHRLRVAPRRRTAACQSSDPLQNIKFNTDTGLIVHNKSGLCVDGGA